MLQPDTVLWAVIHQYVTQLTYISTDSSWTNEIPGLMLQPDIVWWAVIYQYVTQLTYISTDSSWTHEIPWVNVTTWYSVMGCNLPICYPIYLHLYW